MNKILLIISREYLTRVRKKSFIIMTILSPLLFAAMFIIPSWLHSQEDTEIKTIAVEDLSGRFTNALEDTQYIKYEFKDTSDSTQKQEVINQGYDALMVIDNDQLKDKPNIQLYSDGQVTMNVLDNIRHQLNNYLRNEKLASYQIEGLEEKIKEVDNIKVNIQTIRVDEDGSEKTSSAIFAMIVGIASAFLIYMMMIMYGTQVMKGVIEEKANRIVEVIISSVKPFQLMMGKIVGIGLVAITQFLLWIILTLAITGVMQNFIFNQDAPQIQSTELTQQMDQDTSESIEQGASEATFNTVMEIINDSNIITIIAFFIFYFIGGYLVYSALFAAVGSAIDNETETQQFIMPIMLPLIASIYVAMSAFNNPHGDIAFWFSMIPFTSPVVMMSRIPYDVPAWELILSMLILTASFLFLTWFAARVYRTGILMYGKKVSYKEIWKWFIQAGK
jgi:ABC-2 type transport system permease protein